jgi:hypothetical protein
VGGRGKKVRKQPAHECLKPLIKRLPKATRPTYWVAVERTPKTAPEPPFSARSKFLGVGSREATVSRSKLPKRPPFPGVDSACSQVYVQRSPTVPRSKFPGALGLQGEVLTQSGDASVVVPTVVVPAWNMERSNTAAQ